MLRPSPHVTTGGWFLAAFAGAMWVLLVQADGFAAETADPVAMTKTLIVVKVGSEESLPIRTSYQERPPTIAITFPGQRVVASLPERFTVAKGIIQTIATRYENSFAPGEPQPKRFLQSLRIVLTAPYAYRIRSEPGRVVVEIDHPASISSASVEVGLRGGTIIGGLGKSHVSQRFRAMQEALAHATPTPLTLQFGHELDRSSEAAQPRAQPSGPHGPTAPLGVGGAGDVSPPVVASPEGPKQSKPVSRTRAAPFPVLGVMLLAGLAIAGAGGLWFLSRGEAFGALLHRTTPAGRSTRLPSGVVLIDQLVWRGFERQGYQLVIEKELTQPPVGTLRVIAKNGSKAALLFIGDGGFFEKQTVERFIRAMRDVNIEQGFLVASGSFTVPAQRIAKEHHVTLIGREHLVELLSTGAGSEYFTRQLEQSHARLEEAKETLRQYAAELDTLRRQRNEASWYLGEERAKAAQQEARLDEMSQLVHRDEAEIQRWEQEVSTLRKQWEESQWYLGESQAHSRHLETQRASLQEIAKRVEIAEREREEAQWYLAEERARHEALNTRFASLQTSLEESATRERALQDALAQLKQETSALRIYGERRRCARARIPQVSVEVHNGAEGPIFAGSPRDVSGTGVGLETGQELPLLPVLRIRLVFPGREAIESKAQIMWRQAGGQPTRYQSGYRLIDLPDSTRHLIEGIVEQSQSPRA